MEVDFTPEEHKRLTQIAAAVGTDAKRLVKDAALRLLEEDAAGAQRPTAELPLWHLGSVGRLRRHDIYDDAR